MAHVDSGRLVGRAVATGWSAEDFQRKLDVEADLRARGLEGAALEEGARKLLAEFGVQPEHEAASHNALVNVGIQIWEDLLIGAGGTVYSNANAALGVGDASTAYAATQTNLQGAATPTNRLRKGMDSTYPSRATNVLTFRSTFSTSEANWVWNEWAIFNGLTDPGNQMLNRAVANLGTKTAASAWQLTSTLTLS